MIHKPTSIIHACAGQACTTVSTPSFIINIHQGSSWSTRLRGSVGCCNARCNQPHHSSTLANEKWSSCLKQTRCMAKPSMSPPVIRLF